MNENDKKLTVTIGIPAHNEEKTIGKLLDSILFQKRDSFDLEKIIVAIDGCTDKTSDVVKKYQKMYKHIYLIDDGKRLGQAERLNKFYQLNTSDVFVTFDADCKLESHTTLQHLVNCFYDKKVGLASGVDTPYAPQNFFEKIVTTWLKVWYYTRKDINGGNSIHNHHGVISAVRGDAVKHFRILKRIKANDDYLFLRIMKKGYTFCFEPKAKVLYRAPNNVRDFFLQHGRMYTLKNKIFEHFGDWAKPYYKVPLKNKVMGLLKVFLEDPIYLILSIVAQVVLRLTKDFFIEKYTSGGVSWEPAESTKISPNVLKGAF